MSARTRACTARSRPATICSSSCEVTTSGAVISPRLAACPLEPRASAASPGDDGRLTVWLSTQTPHQDKMGLSLLLGLEADQVRVVAPDVGGGFGGKGLGVEDVLLAYLARKTGSPLRWTETRSENLVAMHHGRAQRIDFEIGGKRDGTIEALRWRILQDAGAYPGLGAFLPNLTAMMASGVYRIPKIEIEVTAVVTNTTPTGPVRGAGRPEATQALERAMDMFAADLSTRPGRGAPQELHPQGRVPVPDRVRRPLRHRRLRARARPRAREAGLRRSCAPSRPPTRRTAAPHRARHRDLSVYVEITNGITETEFGAVEITGDGEAVLQDRLAVSGAGSRDDVRDDRLRAARESRSRRSRCCKGDTDVVAARNRHVRLEVDPDRRRRRRTGVRGGRRDRQAARRRGARGQPRGHGARRRCRAASTWPARRRPR